MTKSNENKSERAIIFELQKRGWWAAHMDCGVGGFTNVLALHYDQALLLEVRDASENMKLKDFLGGSQPLFLKKMEEAKNNPFIIVGDGNNFSLFSATLVFYEFMEEEDAIINDLPITCSGNVGEVVEFIERLMDIIPSPSATGPHKDW
jgi:hypothetical protein